MRTLPVPDPDVVAQQIADETVLVHLKTNDIYTLNRTAGELWRLLPTCEHRSDLVDQLAQIFDVSRAALEEEVGHALESFGRAKLVISEL